MSAPAAEQPPPTTSSPPHNNTEQQENTNISTPDQLSNAQQPTNTTSEPMPQPEVPLSTQSTHSAQTEDTRGGQDKAEGVTEAAGQTNGTIELVEHTPETITLEEAEGMSGTEAGDWVQDGDQMKRVKVYELIGSRWVDQGTAFCFGQFQDDTGEALLIARAERDFNDIILRTVIRSNDVYQRQQETLIVWTEPDGVDYALSFQDPEGCSEVWNFITEVQQHMNSLEESNGLSSSPILGSDTSVTTASIIRSGHLPTPALGIISEIERAIKALARTQAIKERICEYIQHEEYIKSLIEVLHTAEDLESLDNLHALCSLTQTILMLNDHALYEHVLDDELFYGVVGMLEYDPDFPTHKANYRDFLKQSTQYHQPIPIQDPVVQRKIHHVYRLQFLKDVVLARALDDSTFNVLNSCIIFNQIDIISHIQQDQAFLKDIVRLFVDEEVLTAGQQRYNMSMQIAQQQRVNQGPVVISLPAADQEDTNGDVVKKEEESMDIDTPSIGPPTPPRVVSPKPANGVTIGRNGAPNAPAMAKSRVGGYSFAPPDDLSEGEINHRREVVLLIQQLCIMGKNIQLPQRMALFRNLVDRGILFAVQWALGLPEGVEGNRQMISAAGEVLSALLDHDLNGVRGHVLKQVMAIEKERAAGKRGADKAETLLEMVCRMMARSKDLAVQSLVGDALKVWMDIPSGDGPGGVGEASHAVAAPKIPARKDDAGTERFLEYFYKECVHVLFKPLLELQEWRNVTDPVLSLTREQSNRYVYLCDLLYNLIQQHHFRSNFYILSANIIVAKIATLLKSKDKHLRHASFRIFRLLLKQNNAHIHGMVMKHDVLKPILDLTLQESRRDNLLSCSCQEYFESMRRDNMKELIKFCMLKHEEEVRKLADTHLGGQRFELLIRRFEMNNEPPPKESESEKLLDTRPRPGQSRFFDTEEEDYFNADDEDDDDDSTILPSISQQSQTQWNRQPSSGLLSPGKIIASNQNINISSLKRKRGTPSSIVVGPGRGGGYRPPLRTPSLRPLVDYGDDDDEEAIQQQQQQADSASSNDNSISTLALAPSPMPSTTIVGIPTLPKSLLIKEEEDEDEDNLLEALVRGKTPGPSSTSTSAASSSSSSSASSSSGESSASASASVSPTFSILSTLPLPTLSSPPTTLAKLGEKRRRGDDDDDDDELLSRLSKSKKQHQGSNSNINQSNSGPMKSPSSLKEASSSTSSSSSNPLSIAKKIKVKIGGFGSLLGVGGNKSSLASTATTPATASTITNLTNNSSSDTSTRTTSASSSNSPSPSSPSISSPTTSPAPAPSDNGIKDGDTG